MRRPLSCGDAERVPYVRPSPGFRPTLTTLRETAAVRLPGWDGQGDAVVAVEDSPMTDVNGSQVGVVQCGSSFSFFVTFCVSPFHFISRHILRITFSPFYPSHFVYHISTFHQITFHFLARRILRITSPLSYVSLVMYHISTFHQITFCVSHF